MSAFQLKELDKPTCSIVNQKNGCVSFVRNDYYFRRYVTTSVKNVMIFAPVSCKCFEAPSSVMIKYSSAPEFEFTKYHNAFYKDFVPEEPTIGRGCFIHPTVVMNAEGLKVINSPTGEKIQFKHTGNIKIGNDVEIGPYSVIHRGTMDTTLIGNGVKMAAFVNVGHNNYIDDNTIIAANVVINGSTTIGKNCWLGSGTLIKHGLSICDNTVIGLGAVVVKNIEEAGVYVGNPARYLKPVEEGWNF